MAGVVAWRPRYYAAIRASFRRFKELYPDAVFPDVYFLIGAMNSAGTTGSSGLLIGVEMNGHDERTPVDELSNWERAVTGLIANMPYVVAHELVHIRQPQQNGKTTLTGAGVAGRRRRFRGVK